MTSVIIPVYNRVDKLREALRSLTLQTMKRFFVIVCDDASTEDVKSVVKEFENSLHIFYLRSDVNRGPGPTRQMGLDCAMKNNMETVMFLDADDVLCPHALHTLTSEINHTMLNMVVSPILVENDHCAPSIKKAEESLVWLHGKIYRTSFLYQNHIHFPFDLRTNEDAVFNYEVYAIAQRDESCVQIDTPVYVWRNAQGSLTRTEETFNECISNDYIKMVYTVLSYFEDKNYEPTFFVSTLFSLYNYYENAIVNGLKITDESMVLLRYCISSEMMKKALSKREILVENQEVIRFWGYNKEIKMFPQSFGEFIKEFGGDV